MSDEKELKEIKDQISTEITKNFKELRSNVEKLEEKGLTNSEATKTLTTKIEKMQENMEALEKKHDEVEAKILEKSMLGGVNKEDVSEKELKDFNLAVKNLAATPEIVSKSNMPEPPSDEFVKKYIQKSTASTTNAAYAGIIAKPAVYGGMYDANILMYSSIRDIATVMSIDSESMEFTNSYEHPDGSTLGMLGETQAANNIDGNKFGTKKIETHRMAYIYQATRPMITDARFPLIQDIARSASTAKGIKESQLHLTGTGSGEIRGILSYTAGTGLNQIERIDSTGLTIDQDFAETLKKIAFTNLKEPYYPNARYMMHRSTLYHLSIIKYTDSHYIINGIEQGIDGFRIGGLPIKTNYHMDAPSAVGAFVAGKQPVICGDFKEYYILDKPSGSFMLVDPYKYMDTNIIRYIDQTYTGGDVRICEAFKVLKTAS